MMLIDAGVETRFWPKVDIREPDECWPWIGGSNPKGYGKFWLDGKLEQAHRIAWELEYGPIPNGADILHDCDNPSCVNARHLHPGNQSQNAIEAIERGLMFPIPPHKPGAQNGQAKVVDADVLEIRRLAATGKLSQTFIGAMFGIHQGQVSRIILRKNWRHIR